MIKCMPRRFSALGLFVTALLCLLASAAHAETGWEDNYRAKRWPTSYSACLDGEALPRIGTLQRANSTLQNRHRRRNASEYLPDEESLCRFVIERSLGSRSVTVQIGSYTNFRLGSGDPCAQGTQDSSGHCMPLSTAPQCPHAERTDAQGHRGTVG